jgi:integrase
LKGGKLARKKHFQHGSLFKRGKKNKVWVARFWEPIIGTNGEPARIRRSEILGSVAELPTKREAEVVLSNRLRRINSANYNPRSCCLFRDFVEEWKTQALPALKYATQKHYEYVIDIHLKPAFGNVQLRLISRESIQTLLGSKLKDLSWRTVKHIRTTLGTILGTAEAWGYIEDNPVRKTRLPRRGPRPEKQVLSPEQLQSLLEKLPEPSKSLVWLLLLTGLRIGELLALRWQDVDLKAGVLRVRRTLYEGHFDEPKTRSSARVVPLGPKGRLVLSKFKPESTDNAEALVFQSSLGTPLCRRNLSNRQLVPVCEELKIEKLNWHSLRHANATLLDSVGTPLGTVQALLGHSSPEITRGVYLHSLPTGAREAVEKLEALLIGPNRTQIEEIPETGSSLIQ